MKRYEVLLPQRPFRCKVTIDRDAPAVYVYEEFENIIEVGFWLLPDGPDYRILAEMDPNNLATYDKMTLADVDIKGYVGLSIT